MEKREINILKKAIELETEAHEFFIDISEKTEVHSLKKFFKLMADDEKEHIEFLENQIEFYSKNNKFQLIFENQEEDEKLLQELTADIKSKITNLKFESEAIILAIDFEQKTAAYYKEMAEKSDSADEEKVFKFLYYWETEHKNFLEEIKDEINDELWKDKNLWELIEKLNSSKNSH
jgi:rubrerythrin